MKRILNEKEYKEALNRIASVFDSHEGSPEYSELDELSIAVQQYEIENLKK
jgi:antitoxin component HigA of HigAB toxin-antitoxin module